MQLKMTEVEIIIISTNYNLF